MIADFSLTAVEPVLRRAPSVSRAPSSPVRFIEASSNRKLSPTDGFTPRAPFCSSTYASIEATCPASCAFKGRGCYAQTGFTRHIGEEMNAAVKAGKMTALDVTRAEARAIDEAFGGGPVPQDGWRGRGRDLRIHVGGEISCVDGAWALGEAVLRFQTRGGQAAWTYTHRWREIAREAWGFRRGAVGISVLASVERPAEILEAAAAGYAAAIVVSEFPSGSPAPFELAGAEGWKVIPCPYETRAITCVACRLCMDDSSLLAKKRAIGFSVHGALSGKVKRRLDVLNGRGQVDFNF